MDSRINMQHASNIGFYHRRIIIGFNARKTLCAVICFLAIAGASGEVFAQINIPANEIKYNKLSESCAVTLIPTETYGIDPPRLTIVTVGKRKPDTFGIDVELPASTLILELVYLNQRQEFQSVRPVLSKIATKSHLWSVLVESQKKGIPFFLTATNIDGSYASSRYQGVEPKGIISILEAQCGFRSDAVTSFTPAQLRARERELRLTADQMRHIRWVLNSKFGSAHITPTDVTSLTNGERHYLEKYAKSIRVSKSRYLNEILVNRLLRERFLAAKQARTKNSYSKYSDWESYKRSADRCAVSTSATDWTGTNLYTRPEIMFTAKISDKTDYLYFDMVSPNPFRTGAKISVIVDGRRYALQVRNNYVMPPKSGKGLSDSIMKAIQRGRTIVFHGIAKDTGKAATIQFSASGFTKAVNRMMQLCNRPGLREWFR